MKLWEIAKVLESLRVSCGDRRVRYRIKEEVVGIEK